ncbi:MAG: exodeoxyribonuclease VII small subunit [Gemmiger sp.]
MRTPKNFEDGLNRLQTLLTNMQSEDTSLAESVKLYAEAAELIRFCNDTLNNAKLQIEEIDAALAAKTEAEG